MSDNKSSRADELREWVNWYKSLHGAIPAHKIFNLEPLIEAALAEAREAGRKEEAEAIYKNFNVMRRL